MIKVAIAPYSAKLEGKPNPKNYPIDYWNQVTAALQSLGVECYQLALEGDKELENVILKIGLPLFEVKQFVEESCGTWVSVDTYLPHLVSTKGVVIWSKSDPLLFGYPHNTNLLKDRSFLREDQWGVWTVCPYDEDAFVAPSEVVKAVRDILKL